ncbi:MAG: dienelactone hydrolase family protein [Polaromonas sp.]|nr:dienelactone hydrolase family protein [Polaromonas sp.]
MKNTLSPLPGAFPEKGASAIAVAAVTFFGVLAVVAAPVWAESAAPVVAAFNSADGTPLTAWVYRSDSLVSKGTVVALHGCGGLFANAGPRKGLVNARSQAMAEMLLEQGYAVVFPDSLGPRGETGVCTQKLADRKVNLNHRRSDALATLGWVATQPWARADRIALLGWSFGGSAVLAATDAMSPDVARQAVTPVLAIAFYPGCAAAMKSHYKPNVPLVMLLGEKDDWTPAEPCKALGKLVGADVKVYAGAYHDFDNPTGGVMVRSNIPNGVDPQHGVHAGRDPAAREQSYEYLRQVLCTAFASNPGAKSVPFSAR